MIEASRLRKVFGNVTAVDEVSFSAADGVVTGLLGPNGAGKTTTLRMLTTLLAPDRGEARIDGLNVAEDSTEARRRIGILPDARGLYARLTAREHIEYAGALHGISRRQLSRRVDALIDLLEMADIVNRRAEGFSQGERFKVALARALVHEPRNVMLDEPTNGLDVMSTRAVRELIRRLRGEGNCVLLSSHVMQEVSALCDRIVIIAGGRVLANGSPSEICATAGKENLEEAFVSVIGSTRGLGQ